MPRRKIYCVVALLFLVVLLKIGYGFYNNYSYSNNLNAKQIIGIDKVELDTINQYQDSYNNEDIIATLKVDGADIDVVVVQTNDNEYYLSHTETKEKNKYGAIFMDYRNKISDQKLIIYGHSSTRVNPPFTNLMKYVKKSFYSDHKYITLKTMEGISEYIIFSIMINLKGNHRHTALDFNESQWADHIKWMNENSIYDTGVKANVNDKILTLQTCYYSPKDSYLVINAKKI